MQSIKVLNKAEDVNAVLDIIPADSKNSLIIHNHGLIGGPNLLYKR